MVYAYHWTSPSTFYHNKLASITINDTNGIGGNLLNTPVYRDFFHQLVRLYRPFERELNEQLTNHGLYRSQWTVLFYLHHHQTATLVEISKYQGIEKPNVTRTINRLEELGFVEQTQGMDKREKRVRLTTKGELMYKDVRKTIDHFEEQITAGIREEELQNAVRIMKKIHGNLRNKGMEV